MKTLQQHNRQIKKIAGEIKSFSNSKSVKKIRFFHGDTNSTRKENKKDYFWINISHLDDIIEINKEERFVLVEPNVSMDKLAKITLEFGMIPQVVMEFPGITVGGGINGAALESSSFKYGQFNDTCLEYEMILGNGKILKASEKNNQDIFYGSSGSYGSLGLVTLIKIKLISSSKYVKTTFYPFSTWKKTLEFITKQSNEGELSFLEGIVFGINSSVIITGLLTDTANGEIKTYSAASDIWFYERAKKVSENNEIYEEYIPIKDYLFRYNRGAFWIGGYAFSLFHIPKNKISSFLLNPLMNTRKLHDGLTALNLGQKYFVQDFYVPLGKTLDFLSFNDKNLGIYPVWLCLIKPTKSSQMLSPSYNKENMLMDIGIWGKTKKYSSNPIGINRKFEEFVKNINSRKMLYAHAYYTEEEFWNIYDKDWYKALRKKYHAEIFPSVWQKVHVSETYKVNKWRGILKVLGDTLLGKHINT